MRRILKWLGIAVAVVLVLLVAGVGVALALSSHRMNATWDVKPHPITIPTDAASIAEGKRLYAARGCAECHGEDLGGKRFIDDPALGQWYGANLTTIVPSYTEADWDRTVRQGVKPNGKSVFFMPASEMYFISDHDLGAIAAYVKSAPRNDRPQPVQKVGVLAHVLHALDLFVLDPARKVDHDAPRPADLKPAVSVEFGERLAKGQCMDCHGAHLSGGPLPGAPPSLPVPKNLTPHASGLGAWTQAQFVTAMRTGKRPDGKELNPFIPWKTFSNLSDEELGALWVYLRSVPPRPFGHR